MKRAAMLLALVLIALLGKAQLGMTLKQINARFGNPQDVFFNDKKTLYYLTYNNMPPFIDGLPRESFVCVFRSDSPDAKCIGVMRFFPNEYREPISKLLSSFFPANKFEHTWHKLLPKIRYQIAQKDDKHFVLIIQYF